MQDRKIILRDQPLAIEKPLIKYPDASKLTKATEPPVSIKKSIAPALLAAIIVAFLIVSFTVFRLIITPASNQAQINENCMRAIDYQLVKLTDYIALDDAAIKAALAEQHFVTVDIKPASESAASDIDLFKAPKGMSAEDATTYVDNGISNLSAIDLSRFLNGSWRFTVDRSATVTMRLRYADFSSGSIDAAIYNALKSQGWDSLLVIQSGIDDNGNTYKLGELQIGETTYVWRISSIALDEVYSQKLVNDAYYVGIRLENKAE